MSQPFVDLNRCADEPIRVPGAVQPHGRMIVLAADDERLLAFSENWSDEAQAANAAALLRPRLAGLQAGDSPAALGQIEVNGQVLDVAAHRTPGLLIIEVETATGDRGTQAPIYLLARHFLPQLQQAASSEALFQLAVTEMKRLTGFGRCLLYRFDEEGHGEVLAERLDEGYQSYAGHRFPASDIPAQARELYRLNHIRVIPDANYVPVALRCVDAAWRPSMVDLSMAGLRSVSPVHLEYMRNMGTLASMSVSIVVRGQLWGLISCHDHEPHHLPFHTRAACEHLGRLLSLQIEAKEDNAEVAHRLALRQLMLEIVSHLAESDATLQRLMGEPGPLLRLGDASGAAIVLNDQCWLVGQTPDVTSVHDLARWIAGQDTQVYQTDRLAESYPPAAAYVGVCAGVMAISISQVHRHLILWFRPEIVQTIQWAGEPHKEAGTQDGRLHPRRSFASWKEQVRGRSQPWLHSHVAAAGELRQALVGIVLRRAEEMAEVVTELSRVNKELEAFSYTVSHDLRAPMRHIAGYVDLVVDSEGHQLGERSHRYLSHVKEAAAFAGQLVDSLLDFSRMGRAALKQTNVDLNVMVEALLREVSQQDSERVIDWQVDEGLPSVWGDPFLLQVAVRNLLGNAIKYTRGKSPATIHVSAVVSPQGCGLEITDNGVGFQMKYVAKLFGVFQRLHQAEEFEGTGIGLANVRRIIERHGGAVWARGEPGHGATFGFTIPPKSKDNF